MIKNKIKLALKHALSNFISKIEYFKEDTIFLNSKICYKKYFWKFSKKIDKIISVQLNNLILNYII